VNGWYITTTSSLGYIHEAFAVFLAKLSLACFLSVSSLFFSVFDYSLFFFFLTFPLIIDEQSVNELNELWVFSLVYIS